MRRKFFVEIVMIVVVFCFSCNNTVKQTEDKKLIAENRILQREDGTISLRVDKAVCYSNKLNPSNNTAEWDVVVLKSGLFNIQVISEKILPPDNNDEFSIAENTKLLKVFFTPETQ